MRSGYLAYLSSGSVDEMYRVMWECGKLTREDLGKMCRLEAIQPVGLGLALSKWHFRAIAYLVMVLIGFISIIHRVHPCNCCTLPQGGTKIPEFPSVII